MKSFQVIKHKNIFLAISGVLMLAAIIAMVLFGFRLAVDFRGGTLWQFRAEGVGISGVQSVKDVFKEIGIEEAIINRDVSSNTFIARLPVLEESEHETYRAELSEKLSGFEELSFQSIGPSVGERLKTRSLWAIALVLIGISLYIAYAFRKVSRPVSSWKYGVVTLITLFHDVLIPAGLLAVLGKFYGLEVDSNFVVALLVIMGFSVHDTIVVFDRIRENLSLERGKMGFEEIINHSVNQTMRRSVNTSLTLLLVLAALFVAGPANLAYFVLTLLIGVTLGTYSSIFVASPALLLMNPRSKG